MSEGTLYDKVWDRHAVTELPTGQTQLFVGLHLVHEVTSPQAFGMLEERGLKVAFPEHTHATVDHIVPTADQSRPYEGAAEEMMTELEENVRRTGIEFDDPTTGRQGIVHVVGPEQGLTQPGKTIVCGDSTPRPTARSARSPSASAPPKSGTCSPPAASPWRSRRSAASR